METKHVVRTKVASPFVVPAQPVRRRGFAALDVDSPSNSDSEEEQNNPTEAAVKKSNGVSWAQVVSEGRKPNTEEEEALPPLGSIVWGAKGGSVWAEE